MNIKELVKKTRTYRRFDGAYSQKNSELTELVELARNVGSGSNLQPLKYIVSSSGEMNSRIYSTLAWAGSLPDWPGPDEPERPTGYIVILIDKNIRDEADMDVGIAAQTILLGASEIGLGGCMVGSIQRSRLREILDIPTHFKISLVVAMGKPVEKVVLEDVGPDGSTTYYRKADGTHHVPKRKMEEILIKTI